MKPSNFLRSHFWTTYVAWIVLCAALFAGLRNQGDPLDSRMRSDVVARRAIEALMRYDRRYARYTPVHTSFARSRMDGSPDRWIVLCDKPGRSAMREAVVVEMAADGLSLLRIRRPVI